MVHDITMKIQQRERDIENWDVLKRWLTIYIAEQAIPQFKMKKTAKYVTSMQGFSLDEMQNAKNHQDCWNDFYQLTTKYRYS